MSAESKKAIAALAEWMAVFSESIFVILKVYADESETSGPKGSRSGKEFIVIGGYIATQEEWLQQAVRWRGVLDKDEYKVENFHFRKFNSRDDCALPASSYYGWSPEKRDNFFYDLAWSITDSLVPIGSAYPIKVHKEKKLTSEPNEELFKAFFSDVRAALDSHWPGYAGRVLFVFDKTNSKAWRDAAFKVREDFEKADMRFGGLTFENDEDPMHVGLQVTDFFAAIYRQAAELRTNIGQLVNQRVIDLILFRHLRPVGHPWHYANMEPRVFKLITEMFRADERRQKREWRDQGLPGKRYYPSKHFPFQRYMPK